MTNAPQGSGSFPPRCIVCAAPPTFCFVKSGYEIFRCARCGLGCVGQLPTSDELAEFYGKTYYNSGNGLGYASEYGELESGLKKTYRRFLPRAERLHPEQRFDRVLDVGGAYGFFLDVAEERWSPSETVAVDVTPEAREHNLAKGRRFHHGFFEQVDLPEAHFDLAFMGDAFEHVRDPVAVADQFSRVLAPGGVLVITTVNFAAWIPRLLGARWRLMTPPEHLYFWTRASLTRLFADRGLSGRVGRYWLFYPKSYVYQAAKRQFGVAPRFLDLLPGQLIPIPSFDVLIGIFQKRV